MNKNYKSVSIVIPAYNEEHHLARCLDSIARQTIHPYEVIVVDNNSTDATATIAKRYPFVRVITEAKQGIVYARTAGFNAVKGDIIGRIDADVVLPKSWVAYIAAFYTDGHHNEVWSGRGIFMNVRFPKLVSWAYSLMISRFNWCLTGHTGLWGSNMAMLTSQWRQVRTSVCIRTDIHEDLDLAIHCRQHGLRITHDTRQRVYAVMRRVMNERGQLWSYLQQWPRTLRVHGYWLWPICWFLGAFGLYVASYVLVIIDSIATKLGFERRSLPPS